MVLAAQSAHGDVAAFGVAHTDGEDDRDLGERVFAHLVADLFVAQIWLHAQARKWLGARLADLQKKAKSGDGPERAQAATALASWFRDPALVSVRDPKWLAVMPAEDREAWAALWAEATALRKLAGATKSGSPALRRSSSIRSSA